MTEESNKFDVVVVGGGVNGTGIAMDAAGRGLKVLLCEMNDLASATSSSSSKLIHGGLRYLEHYEFRLVREALAERESLLRNSPHIMWPMRFRLPHRPHLRPAWMIRTGLFLYDHLAKREILPGSRLIKFDEKDPLKSDITKGFEYSDGWVDDARLVVLTAKKAQECGATILTRTKCINAERGTDSWDVSLQDMNDDSVHHVTANVIVNASGPWVSSLFSESLSMKAPKTIRMVKGSHIVVPRLNRETEAYILQNEDERIVFVIPYEDEFSLVGTTDVDYEGDPKKAKISPEETEYLLDIVNGHFKRQLTENDVVWSYSGVRPLMDDEEETPKRLPVIIRLKSAGKRTRRRSSPCLVARLRPTANSRKQRRTNCANSFPRPAAHGRRGALCRVATSKITTPSRPACQPSTGGFPRRSTAAMSAPMAPRPTTFWATRNPFRTWAIGLPAHSTSVKSNT